jgi:HEAT repeat protein
VTTFFCPQCWEKIPGSVLECPHCRYDLSGYERLSYEEKLVLALRHPLRENRLMAIRLLGELKSQMALALFESMLKTEEDFFVVREVIYSLTKIGNENERNRQIIQALRDHPSRLVRILAEEVLAGQGC